MKRFSAQYIFTNTSPPLKRGVVTTDDYGTIISIEDTSGNLNESESVEFYNGIIIPGFVNCHCHLELSHMKGAIGRESGLGGFILKVRDERETESSYIHESAVSADIDMYNSGISLCADICNSTITFPIKKTSNISYINLLEVFGIDPEKASQRIDQITKVAEEAQKLDLPFFFVPHSAYSMSLSLLKLLRDKSFQNEITSIHFAETKGEKEFLEKHSGVLMEFYIKSGLIPRKLELVSSQASAVLNEITQSGNLILVHNTFVEQELIAELRKRENLFWCLCPNSNLYIENALPPVDLLKKEDCKIVIGTDSLASNNQLSILSELITLQLNFPSLSVLELVVWATINGARALGKDDQFGKIEPGKNPGLVLLQNVDLINMKLLSESSAKRLI
jgi:cytosine/adenosine deaminase-related metal-dependent hydrolase